MSFDPDKFLQKSQKPQTGKSVASFDPDAFLSNVKTPEPESTQGQAAIEGFGQGASFGYLPQLQAKLEPITDRVFNLFDSNGDNVDLAPMSQLTSNNEEYLKARDKNVARQKQLRKENPWTYGASEVGGAVASGIAVGGAGNAASAAKKAEIAKRMTSTARMAMQAKDAAKIGAVYGALTNPGDIEGVVNELQLTPRLRNAVVGALTGYGFQKGLDKISQYSKSLRDKLSESAERWAARALGAERSTVKKFGDEKIRETGRYALDNDIVNPSFFDQTKKMADRNKIAKETAGKTMGEVYNQIDDAGASEFNPLNVAAKVDDAVGGFWQKSPLNRAEKNQYENTIEAILQRGGVDGKNIPLREAQTLKQELGKVANWKKNIDLTPKEQMARDAYGVVKDSIDDAVDQGFQKIKSPLSLEDFQNAKKTFSSGETAESLIQNKIAREQGNKYVSLTDGVWGATALAALGPKGLLVLGGKKIAEKWGPQTTAVVMDKFAKQVAKTPGLTNMATNNPSALKAMVYRLAVKNEKNLGPSPLKYLNVAEQEDLKGKEKWIGRGINNVTQSGDIDIENPEVIKKLMIDPRGEKLLQRASSLKPGSKAMNALMNEINIYLKGEK